LVFQGVRISKVAVPLTKFKPSVLLPTSIVDIMFVQVIVGFETIVGG